MSSPTSCSSRSTARACLRRTPLPDAHWKLKLFEQRRTLGCPVLVVAQWPVCPRLVQAVLRHQALCRMLAPPLLHLELPLPRKGHLRAPGFSPPHRDPRPHLASSPEPMDRRPHRLTRRVHTAPPQLRGRRLSHADHHPRRRHRLNLRLADPPHRQPSYPATTCRQWRTQVAVIPRRPECLLSSVERRGCLHSDSRAKPRCRRPSSRSELHPHLLHRVSRPVPHLLLLESRRGVITAGSSVTRVRCTR